jgi:hypothetical protein
MAPPGAAGEVVASHALAPAASSTPTSVSAPIAGLDGTDRSPFWKTSTSRMIIAQMDSTTSGSSASA